MENTVASNERGPKEKKREKKKKKPNHGNKRSKDMETQSKPASQKGDESSEEIRNRYLSGVGTNHPVMEMVHKFREIFLKSGFDEIEHPLLLDKKETKKQFGMETPLVLDNIYYLARFPRRTICSDGTIPEKVRERIDEDKIGPLLEMVQHYCSGELEGIRALEKAIFELGMERKIALEVIDMVLDGGPPEPIITDKMLRWHMTSSWYPVIAALWNKTPLPIRLFTTGLRVRYDPKDDESLGSPSRYTATCVIIDEKIDIERGKDVLEQLLERLDFSDFSLEKRQIASSDYERGEEYTIKMSGEELGNCGMYSEDACHRYGIDVPIFNINISIEKVLMIQKGYHSVAELLFPQFTKAWRLSDVELAKTILFIKSPETDLGKEISKAIAKTSMEHWEHPGPISFKVWEGTVKVSASELLDPKTMKNKVKGSTASEQETTIEGDEGGPEDGRNVHLKISIVSREEGGTLCGPALLNHVAIKDGNIQGARPVQMDPSNGKDGTSFTESGIRFIDGFANAVATHVEALLQKRGKISNRTEVSLKMVHGLEDLNLKISDHGKEFMLHLEKEIDIKGPMHITIKIRFKPEEDKQTKEKENHKGKENENEKKR